MTEAMGLENARRMRSISKPPFLGRCGRTCASQGAQAIGSTSFDEGDVCLLILFPVYLCSAGMGIERERELRKPGKGRKGSRQDQVNAGYHSGVVSDFSGAVIQTCEPALIRSTGPLAGSPDPRTSAS